MNATIYDWVKPTPFFIEFGETYLHGDLLPSETVKPPEILFIHGAQGPGRREFLLLRQVMWDQFSISSCAFDFIGYGTTGGNLTPFNSQQRETQARDIIQACFDLQPFSIVTTEINIEIALCLAESFQLRCLMLLSPANNSLYNAGLPFKIVDIPFNPEQNLNRAYQSPANLAKAAGFINAALQQQ